MGADGFQNALGYGVGTLAALESLRSPGGLGRFLTGEIAARENPNVRASLIGSPFSSGFLFTGGSPQALSLGPAGAGPSAPRRVFTPNLPPLAPEEQAKQAIAATETEALAQATPGQRLAAGRSSLGIPPTPEEALAPYAGLIGPGGLRLRGISAAGMPEFGVAPSPTPDLIPSGQPGILYSPSTGKYVKQGAGAAGGGVKKPFDLWLREHPDGSFEQYTKDAAAGAASKSEAIAKVKEEYAKLPVAAQNTLATIDTMGDVTTEVRRLLQDPEVRGNRGLFEGRLRQALYTAGIAASPNEDAYLALSNFAQIMGVQPFMRGTRNYQFIQQIQQHLPKAGDQPELIEDKLNRMSFYLDHLHDNIIAAAKGRISELQPRLGPRGGPTGTPGASAEGGAPQPGEEVIPGVIYNGPAQ